MVFKVGDKPWNYGTKVMIERQCAFCGKTFTIPEAQAKRENHRAGHYCSKTCFYEAKIKFSLRSQIQPLYEHGKTLQEIADILSLNRNTISSQISRMKIANRFGDGIYSTVSRKRAKTLLKEFFGINVCELCGYSRFTDIAHVIERKNGGQYTLDNCLMLCPNCHRLFDYRLLNEEEKDKLRAITRLNGNLARRLTYESSINPTKDFSLYCPLN